MRREDYCINPTINAFKQESDYALHVLNLQKAKTVINTTPIEPPPHFKQQNDYNQKLRKDMYLQSEYLLSLIPTKDNPQPHPPRARNFNEMFRYKQSKAKKSPRNTKNGRQEPTLPSEFFLTQNQNQQLITPPINKGPVNYYDFDKESYSPTGETLLSVQSENTDADCLPTDSSAQKKQTQKQKQLSKKFNSIYYRPERLNETTENATDDLYSANDDQSKAYHFQLNQNSTNNFTGVEVDDDDFDYNILIQSKNNEGAKNGIVSTPKPKPSDFKETDDTLSNDKKDDSVSDAFASNPTSPIDKDNKSQNKNNRLTPTLNNNNSKKYPLTPSQQLAKLNSTNNSTQPNQSEKRTIWVKKKRIHRRRVPKNKNYANQENEDEEEEEIHYMYARTTNGKPYQIIFIKPSDPMPPNSAIVQMDTTRIVVVRSAAPLEIVETDNPSSLPNNSIYILPNQKKLMKRFIVKKTSITSPTMSSFVITSIDNRPLHFIYIQPDREVPPDAFLVNRDNRIRVAVKGQLKITQIKLGDPLPPNSIRTPSFINQPRRTVCIVPQEDDKLNFITVRNGDEFQLPENSIIVHNDNFTKTAIVSNSMKPLEYVSVQEGGKVPQNAAILYSNVLKKKPPKMAVIPSKSSEDESEFLSFITVKNDDQLPLNSIVVESDDRKILALVPNGEEQKIQSILVGEEEELPKGAIYVDLSLEKMVPNVGIESEEPLKVGTFSNKGEIPKNSLILKEDDKVAVTLSSPQNQPLHATSFKQSELNSENQITPNSYIIESSVIGEKSAMNRVTVISPDRNLLNAITLKSVDDLPQNSVIVSTVKHESDEDGDKANEIKRVIAAIAQDDQPLQMANLNSVSDGQFLSKLPKNAKFISTHDNDKDEPVTNNIRFAVKSPDDSPLNVITVMNEDDIPHNSVVIGNDEKATIAVVSPNNQPLQLVTLTNGEHQPINSYVLPKDDKDKLNDTDQVSTENIYTDKLAITSNNEKPLKLQSLNENEEIPQNSIIIQSGDFGNIVAVSNDDKEIRLTNVKKGEKTPSNCVEIPLSKKGQEDNNDKAKLCVVSPDSDPLQIITLRHGDELPKNSFVIESDEDKITAVTSPKPIQIRSVNEGEEIPKNAILIDNNSQKFAFSSPNGEPLNILTIKPGDEIPPNSKVIQSDGKNLMAISSPSQQPLLISTLKEGEEPPANSFIFDPANKDPNKEPKIALFSPDKKQLNISTLKPTDDLPQNSILVKNDKNSSVAISSPNSQPLSCISLKKDDEAPTNSFVFNDTQSLFYPFTSRTSSNENNDNHNSEDINDNDNDYNDESEYEETNNNTSNNENKNKFESIFSDISKGLTNDINNISSNKNSPRIIVESNDKEPLKFITLSNDDEIPDNSMIVPVDPQNGYTVCITSPNNEPLHFVNPESFDNDRDQHVNAVDITQPNRFVVSSSDENKTNIVTVKTGEKLPQNSAIISQDDEKTVAIVGDPALNVSSLKSDQVPEELPPNSIQPLISSKSRGTSSEFNETANDDNKTQSSSRREIKQSANFRIAVLATPESPLYLVTQNHNDQIPQNSIVIEKDSEKVVYAVSTTKTPLKCLIVSPSEPVPDNSFIVFDQSSNSNEASQNITRIAIFTENRRQFHFLTLSKDDRIPPNSYVIRSDDNYRDTITSPTTSPLCFYVLKDDENPPENFFVGFINSSSVESTAELMNNCAVASSDNSPLCILMAKKGEKLPNNSAIISRKGARVFALSPQSDFKPLLLYVNPSSIPENAVFLDLKNAYHFAVASKDGKQLSYTIVKDGSDSQFPTNSFVIDTEGGPNPRSLAVVPPDGQKLVYIPIHDDSQLKKLPKNSIRIDRDPNTEDEMSNKFKIVVRGQDGKPLKFLTINKSDEMPENAIVIHEEVNGKKIVVQAFNKKPLQYLILDANDELPRNAIAVSNDKEPIERIVVMSSCLVSKESDANSVSDGEKANEPLQYVILKPNEETPQNAAVIKREGGRHPRRLAVKSPTGHSLKYAPIHVGEEIPANSVTFCRQPTQIDSFANNNACGEDNSSLGVFNKTGKAAVAVTSTDTDKAFQYIIAKFGDRLPRNMVALFKEGGEDPRTVAVNSADESSSPLLFFFVNPGQELPPNSVFLDECEVRKSITVIPGPGSDPLLDFEEIGVDDLIPENAVVVATIKKDGKLVRIVVKSNDNSPLLPSLTRPGFEPRNAIILNRRVSGSNEEEIVSNYDDIIEQLSQLQILKEKRMKIMNGQINSPETDDNHSSITTQTTLSAEAFVKDALQRFDLYLTIADDQKGKKKKVTTKRKKKKSEATNEEEDAKETNAASATNKNNNDGKNSPHQRIFAPANRPGKQLTFGESPVNGSNDQELIQEEEEDVENTEELGDNQGNKLFYPFNTPISKQKVPVTSLIMDKEKLKRQFFKSPVKYDNNVNSIAPNTSRYDDMKRAQYDSMSPFFSARSNKMSHENRADSVRSFNASYHQTNKFLSDTPKRNEGDKTINNNSDINNGSNLDVAINISSINNSNNSDFDNNYINGDVDESNIKNLNNKNFNYSNQFENEMTENKNRFQNLPFSQMIELTHIDREILPTSRQTARPGSVKNLSLQNTPQTPKTPKTPKPPIPQKLNTTPENDKTLDHTNTVRFV